MGYGAILGQAADAFTKTQTLTSATSALFGKDGAAVPNDIFKTLSNSVLLQNIQTLLPSTNSWQSVTYGNGKFVAVSGNSGIGAYSEDGINWTSSALSSPDRWRSVTYGNGKFVVVAYNSNATAYSTDGINWNSEGPTISYPDGTPLYNAMMSILGLPGVQIATGSYVGTNKYGADNPNSLTFNFSPKAIIIIPSSNNGWSNDENLGVFVYGAQYPSMSFDGGGQSASGVVNGVNTVTGWGSNTIRWNNNQYSNRQLNDSGYTYFYIAFG